MSFLLYDLAGAEDDRRFSPFCWRTKLCLKHKGLDFETVPWRFTERDAISFTGQGRVPVLVDKSAGDKAVWDSWDIARYLDSAYPENPLIPEGAENLVFFTKCWVETAIHPKIAGLLLWGVYSHLADKDRDYFRTSREKVFGRTLEEIEAGADAGVEALRATLQPLRLTLKSTDFLGGNSPNLADYIAFSPFAWARAISERPLLEADDPVHHWRERMMDLYDGYVRKAPGYPVI